MGMAEAVAVSNPVLTDKNLYFGYADYKPHPAQKQVHDSDARFRVVVAGRRWGKSLSAAREAERMILTPGTGGWIVAPTYDLARKVFSKVHQKLILKYRLKPTLKNLSGPIRLEFPWGSWVEAKSADNPDSLTGEGLHWLIFDEAAKCKEIIWEQYLRPTLTDYTGWALFITTPVGYNWIYDLFKRGRDPDHPDWASFHSPSWDNPYLTRSDIEEAHRTLPEAVFLQEYGAQFTTTAGQVYKDFNESVHIVPYTQLKLHKEWPRFRSIDFGYENPFVCLYIAVDPEDRVIIYDEFYQRHRTIEHCARMLNAHEAQGNTRYQYNTCDPQGAGFRATLLENGIPTVAYRQDVKPGLDDVRKQLRIREDGKPGLYVSSRCVETIKEFNLYSYPEDPGAKEEPVKENDHCMDALRYFVVRWRKGPIRELEARYM